MLKDKNISVISEDIAYEKEEYERLKKAFNVYDKRIRTDHSLDAYKILKVLVEKALERENYASMRVLFEPSADYHTISTEALKNKDFDFLYCLLEKKRKISYTPVLR